jgi:hypothetical protein
MHVLIVTTTLMACAFAPVPPPRTGVAEAVFGPTSRGAQEVRRSLLAALPRALQSEKVRSISCLKGERSPAKWVEKRLRVEEVSPGGRVRVRLDGCRPNEALALLTALVDAYEASRRAGVEYEVVLAGAQLQRRVWAARVAQAQGGRINLNEVNVSVGTQGGPAVLQRPRLVGTGKAR